MRADKASRLGVTLQSIIEVWLAERLRQPACNKSFRTPRSTRAAENAADWLAFARWEAQHSRYAFGIECEAGYLIRPVVRVWVMGVRAMASGAPVVGERGGAAWLAD
ncbi:MAG: hypothetical protein H6961_11175 [Chromatiaceae bacterium]|nr:hypothetical protein [Chromatiaceae bacterium]